MKASTVLSAPFLALAMAGWTHIAAADSMQASCEVRKDGEQKKGQSGPCTFSQRQGYIDLDLRNGNTFSLSPAGQANHFKDQKGNKVVRTGAGGNSQEFKWEGGKRVLVHFSTNSSASTYGAAGYNQGGGTSTEYKRGYNDALKGNAYDQDRHPQDYKDGFRAGEDARQGGPNSYNKGGNSNPPHSINRLSNGGFEVVWPQNSCIASFNARGEAMSYSNGCNDNLISKSQEIARHER